MTMRVRGMGVDPTTGADTGAAAGALTSLCCFAYLVPIVLGIAAMVLWIIALVDVLSRKDWEFPGGANDRVVWVLVVLLLNGLGALVYYFMVMRRMPRRR